jgi:hypothetical protein
VTQLRKDLETAQRLVKQAEVVSGPLDITVVPNQARRHIILRGLVFICHQNACIVFLCRLEWPQLL